jgi:hypothetical protein
VGGARTTLDVVLALGSATEEDEGATNPFMSAYCPNICCCKNANACGFIPSPCTETGKKIPYFVCALDRWKCRVTNHKDSISTFYNFLDTEINFSYTLIGKSSGFFKLVSEN